MCTEVLEEVKVIFKTETETFLIPSPFEASYTVCKEAEFLDEINTEVFRIFLLAIHSHLYSFALRFLFLQTTP
jgi:hypothetical protein